MSRTTRRAALAGVTALALVASACGTAKSSSTSSYSPGGTLQVSMGSPPESLDPQVGYSAESEEADWLVYTGLLTYAHANGPAGTKLIPGLATALPSITEGGKTYTLTLRPGLKFSNGTPVTASDFAFTVQRAVKLWGGASWFTGYVQGAAAYEKGKAKTISGITTDNSTRQIVIHLMAPYGGFSNVLAFPAAGLVPSTTPMSAEPATPPPGVGPYEITKVQTDVGFTLKKTPNFAGFHIAGIPDGYANGVQVTYQSNIQTEAQNVLANKSDEFDWGDVLPAVYLSKIKSQASGRFKQETIAGTDYYWLNTAIKPFNNVLAREAANLAVNRVALARLASGQITPACYYLPPGIVGHPSGPCPLGAPSGAGSFSAASLGSPADVAKAKALVKKAGLAGSKVTVWTEQRQPFQEFGTYLDEQLNAIGFKSNLDVLGNSIYDPTIGSRRTHAQAGWSEWTQDFPNPADFYYVLDATSILPVNNGNLGNVNDPHIQKELAALDPTASTDLNSVAKQWVALEKYVDEKDYQVNFGYEVSQLFLSNRVDFAKAIFSPVYGDDWTSFELVHS